MPKVTPVFLVHLDPVAFRAALLLEVREHLVPLDLLDPLVPQDTPVEKERLVFLVAQDRISQVCQETEEAQVFLVHLGLLAPLVLLADLAEMDFLDFLVRKETWV